MSFTQATQARR